MKWYTTVTTVLAAAQLLVPVNANETCKTVYASTPIKKVPTSTTTKTSTVKTTTTVVQTSTETETQTTVFTVTTASTTTTVPTGANFTPIISAHSLSPSSKRSPNAAFQRRGVVKPEIVGRNGVKARRSETSSLSKPAYPTSKPAYPTKPTSPPPPAYPTKPTSSSPPAYPTKPTSSTPPPYPTKPKPYPSKSFPHSVGCTTVRTRTSTSTTTTTFVVGAFVGVTTTVTTQIPTATAYAACGPDNIISTFQGHQLGGGYAADHSLGICFVGNGDSGFEPCLSAEACCAAALNTGYSGFQFTNFTGQSNDCIILSGGIAGEGGFVFYSGEDDGHAFFGNTGVGFGGGVFGGAHT